MKRLRVLAESVARGGLVLALAIALAAKTTLEDFLGAIKICADCPERVGDLCRFDDEESDPQWRGRPGRICRTAFDTDPSFRSRPDHDTQFRVCTAQRGSGMGHGVTAQDSWRVGGTCLDGIGHQGIFR